MYVVMENELFLEVCEFPLKQIGFAPNGFYKTIARSMTAIVCVVDASRPLSEVLKSDHAPHDGRRKTIKHLTQAAVVNFNFENEPFPGEMIAHITAGVVYVSVENNQFPENGCSLDNGRLVKRRVSSRRERAVSRDCLALVENNQAFDHGHRVRVRGKRAISRGCPRGYSACWKQSRT
ncbi:hypothetical protein BDV98DRAFT_656357 [Pterulicium gracile]|uniref:Uncharacterized protein n=1 Tax=Pterulicium gracile TaxID=1884261 RepID=A0A5C3QID0_9AGAR|nr:hypothetical protein BDV98DRAFT_656357 [Pterula gracilis]